MDEKQKRSTYIRLISRFAIKILPTLKNQNLTVEEFKLRIKSSSKFMKDIEKQRLDSSNLKLLEDFCDNVLALYEQQIDDLEQTQNKLLKDWNLIQKSKNNSSYKKDKHKNRSFNDGY